MKFVTFIRNEKSEKCHEKQSLDKRFVRRYDVKEREARWL